MKNVKSIEVITTNSEYEALLLECNLIKTHKPDYNVKLKDGKGYPMVRITHEKYPRIFKTRKIINDQSEYFGPFTNVKKLDQVLDFINKTFKIRKCKKNPILLVYIIIWDSALEYVTRKTLKKNIK